ncbi:MAG: PTS IIA-like nitrogen regulatory protein PtsN [Hyphomicrobiaceae bacterium]|nr:PTS IIA-like nitrogen regulatory protein PtsN [Hyphomicrobiaceae bacterium]
MDLGDLLRPEAVFAGLRVKNKKQALMELAHRAASVTGLDERTVFNTLLQRERLGSTGVGRGIAIPHARIAGLKRIATVFAQLDEAIDFDAPDGEPVDLVFVLLAPEQAGADHLKALARISRVLRDPLTLEKLRAARDSVVLYSVLTEPLASHAA